MRVKIPRKSGIDTAARGRYKIRPARESPAPQQKQTHTP
jgi:hypothetical protein